MRHVKHNGRRMYTALRTEAVDELLAGKHLTPVVHGNHFWFAWAAFKPGTRIGEVPSADVCIPAVARRQFVWTVAQRRAVQRGLRTDSGEGEHEAAFPRADRERARRCAIKGCNSAIVGR